VAVVVLYGHRPPWVDDPDGTLVRRAMAVVTEGLAEGVAEGIASFVAGKSYFVLARVMDIRFRGPWDHDEYFDTFGETFRWLQDLAAKSYASFPPNAAEEEHTA
jgi:hypothetical protein